MRQLFTGLLAALLVCGCGKRQEAVPGRTPVTVKTMVVAPAGSTAGQEYSGTIEEQSGASLSFASLGTVKSLHVGEGQFVAKGQLIGVLDATTARQAYEAAVAAKEQALDAQDRMRLLHDSGSLPDIKWVEVQTQVRQAQASEQIARKGLTDTKLYAPFAGYVARKSVEAGANVGPGVPVVQLVRIDQVKATVSVPEEEVSRISQGTPVTVTVDALGGRSFTGKVVEKGVSADPLSRSYEVKALLGNARHELLPGMICRVSLPGRPSSAAAGASAAVSLPASVIQIDFDNRTFVWTVVGGKARKTYVETGGSVGNGVLVTSGLQPGDRVIVEGQQKVSSQMEVKE